MELDKQYILLEFQKASLDCTSIFYMSHCKLFLVCMRHILKLHCSIESLTDMMYNIRHWKMGFYRDMGRIIWYRYGKLVLLDNLYRWMIDNQNILDECTQYRSYCSKNILLNFSINILRFKYWTFFHFHIIDTSLLFN